MAVFRTLLCILGISAMAGCATHAKPPLADAGYDWFAANLVGTHRCVEAGQMPPETGALGMTYDRYTLSTWSFDLPRMKERIQVAANGAAPGQGWCNTKAMTIAQRRQEIAAHNESVAVQQKELTDLISSTKTVHTYCNQAGTQTFCTSN